MIDCDWRCCVAMFSHDRRDLGDGKNRGQQLQLPGTIILLVFEQYLTSIDDPAMPFWSSWARGESLAPVALRKCISSGDGISWLYRKDLELAWWRMYTNFVRPWDRWMMKCGSGFHWIFRYFRSILMLDWGLPAVSRAVKMSSVGYRYKSVYCRISIDATTLCM